MYKKPYLFAFRHSLFEAELFGAENLKLNTPFNDSTLRHKASYLI